MKKVLISKKERFSKKQFVKPVRAGSWFKLEVLGDQESTGYGKVMEVINDGERCYALVDRYFELPDYRPYAATKWFDNLPFAVEVAVEE